MAPSFVPRAVFPALNSLPRSYYLGHHAAGLAKMRTLLSQIDLIVECRDYRIPLTSRNPQFEDVLSQKERVIVYTKTDLVKSKSKQEDDENRQRLRAFHEPSTLCFSDFRSPRDIRKVLSILSEKSATRQSLTGSHCMVVGMPNVGKSTLLNALRQTGVKKGKVAHTGAQPGVTRKIGTGVKIVEADDHGGSDVYLLDTPGVFIPYVPDAEAMLKLALCGSVKDTVISAFTLADYLLYRVNNITPESYSEYVAPTNDITVLLEAMARKTGRLQKGGEPDTDGTAMWMIQRWRNGYLGKFLLDDVSGEALARYQRANEEREMSVNQARKAGKEVQRQRAKSRKSASAG